MTTAAAMTFLLFVTLFFQLSFRYAEVESASQCSCESPSESVEYDAPSAELFNPSPRIAHIKTGKGASEIYLAMDSISHGKELSDVTLRSIDDGASWTTVSVTRTNYRVFAQSGTIYRVPITGAKLERSSDNGKHWTKALLKRESSGNGGSQPARSYTSFQLAAVDPRNAGTIYGCFGVTSGSSLSPQDAGMYISRDGGDTWVTFASQLRNPNLEEYCLLAIDPENPELMVGHASNGPMITRDGGRNWTMVGQTTALESPAPLKGHKVQFNSEEAHNEKPWPYNWTRLSIRSIEFVPGHQADFYMVTNKGIFKTTDGGDHWCYLDAGQRRLFETQALYIDPRQSDWLYVGTSSEVLLSKDAGCTFSVFFRPTHVVKKGS